MNALKLILTRDASTPSQQGATDWLRLFSLLVLITTFICAFYLTVPAEDAVILYDYAKNLASKGVITYGAGDFPIEGATDFLWMIFIAAFKKLGFDEFASALFFNLIGCAFILSKIRDFKYKILAIVALFLTPYLYAALAGFSAIFFSAVYLCCISFALKKDKRLYLLVLLLCLLRPDGVVWGAGLVLWRFLEEWERGTLWSDVRAATFFLVIPGLLYFSWRVWYFNEWLPLPFLVKSSGKRDLIFFYSQSLVYVVCALAPIIVGHVFAKAGGRRNLILFALPILFYGVMRLEQNIGNRFLAPMFFGALYLFYCDRKFKVFVIFLSTSILLSFSFTHGAISLLASSKEENVYYISKEIAKFKGEMLVTEAGRLAYYSDWKTHDSWGLNTPKFSKQLINEQGIEEGKYDLIVAHCDLRMLDDDMHLIQSFDRSWDNQCKALVSFVKKKKFIILLVPFHATGAGLKEQVKSYMGISSRPLNESCERHDIFAVSPEFFYADKVGSLLSRYGAVRYSADLKKVNGDQVCRQRSIGSIQAKM